MTPVVNKALPEFEAIATSGVKFAVVHHTVNSNTYREADVPAMLASISFWRAILAFQNSACSNLAAAGQSSGHSLGTSHSARKFGIVNGE